MELVERIREILQEYVKNNYKNYRKIRHTMDPPIEEIDLIGLHRKQDIQNLTKKENYTPVNKITFNAWNKIFLLEISKLEQKHTVKIKDKDKPTGKQIFQVEQSDMFFD